MRSMHLCTILLALAISSMLLMRPAQAICTSQFATALCESCDSTQTCDDDNDGICICNPPKVPTCDLPCDAETETCKCTATFSGVAECYCQ